MKKTVVIILSVAAALALIAAPCSAQKEQGNMITYLSDMEWAGAEIYSGANGGKPSRDENVAGEELWLYDMYFEKGVCFHAAPGKIAYIEVNIEGRGFKTFYTYVGTAESELYDVSMASVRFVFKADGKTVARTDAVTPKKRPELLTFDVTDVKTLRIEMDDGCDGISGDWGALGYALFSTSPDVDAITAALAPETEAATEPVTEAATDPVTEPAVTESTEKATELQTEPQTEKAAKTDDVTVKPEREEKAAFPVIPVVAAATAAALITAVIVVLRKRKK